MTKIVLPDLSVEETYGGYEPLQAALKAALDQAALGKGRDRHDPHDLPFAEQPIFSITRMVGLGFPLGQAVKKAQEAATMADRGMHEAARAELLGAIVYLAAGWLALERVDDE